MLFRRVKEHVINENWFAVFIDFAIVVLGVVIGFQITNWNTNLADVKNYKFAVERYQAEALKNLASLEQTEEEFGLFFEIVPQAIEILRQCDDTPENFITVQNALNRIIGTWGIKLQTQALNELNSSPKLLAQQSPKTRQNMNMTAHRIGLLKREAMFIEEHPLNVRVESNPILKLGDVTERSLSYNGIDFSRKSRQLVLSVPLSEACQNDELLKSFYTWERWQSIMPLIVTRLKSEIDQSLKHLES